MSSSKYQKNIGSDFTHLCSLIVLEDYRDAPQPWTLLNVCAVLFCDSCSFAFDTWDNCLERTEHKKIILDPAYI